MGEKVSAEHIQQDLFEWVASIRDKLQRGAKPPYVYSPYKTKHTVKYGQDEKGKFAVINFKMPEGVQGELDVEDDIVPHYGDLYGFRIYTEKQTV